MSCPSKILSFLIVLSIGCQKEKAVKIDLDQSSNELEVFSEDFISTNLYERDIAISSDGKEIIYTLGNYKQTLRSLVRIKKGTDGWGEKQILPFSGKYSDIEPFFSVDGNRLFFASNRPIGADTTRTDYNIWVVGRSNSGWGEPTPLDSLINTEQDEFYPAVGKTGNLYFTTTRENGIGREDIFLSTLVDGEYQPPTALDSTINTAVFEFNAYINPNEDLLVFSSFGRQDGLGGGDLYYSKKGADGHWNEAKNMGAGINSDKLDYCPFVDMPRGNFYFTSDRAKPVDRQINTIPEFEEEANHILNGMGNIYRINLEILDLE